jgi:hypothetical protein
MQVDTFVWLIPLLKPDFKIFQLIWANYIVYIGPSRTGPVERLRLWRRCRFLVFIDGPLRSPTWIIPISQFVDQNCLIFEDQEDFWGRLGRTWLPKSGYRIAEWDWIGWINYCIDLMTKNGLKPWVGECLGCFGMWTDSASAEHLTVQENKHGALVIAAGRPWTVFF